MSAAYFKLKMLKRLKTRSKYTKPESYSAKHSGKPYADTGRCRICLRDGLIPIYNTQKNKYDLAEAIRAFGSVDVKEDDPYPKNLCEECHSLLNGAIIFRKSAKESDEILRQITVTFSESPVLSDNDFTNELDLPRYKTIMKRDYECKICRKKFQSYEEYSQHKKSKTHKKIRIQCKICMKLLTQKLYEKHLARHKSASNLICEVCGKLYRKDNLLRHLQLHSNELPFQCSECPYRGRFLDSLKIHARTHSGDRPFSCDKCKLRFITKSNLNRHLLTHEKEKPHKCVECNRSFYTQKDLDVHIRADHAGIKEFCCRICGNKYGMKKALMRHELRVHKREKMAKGRIPLYMQASFQNSLESKD